MKKVCYIHGAFSAYKPESEKVLGLKESFDVVGISYSMEKTFKENLMMLINFCEEESVDFVVGTSLGGLYAAEINDMTGLPAILINPCVEPQMSLSTIVGKQKNFTTGEDEDFTKELVKTYPNLAAISKGCLVFVGMKDDLIDSLKTEKLFKHAATVIKNEDADHYWEFFKENALIESHVNKNS